MKCSKGGLFMTGNEPTDCVISSIVIPAHNQWHVLQNCLLALESTLAEKSYEIIVVDNGSTDATAEECPGLGETLFAGRFHYLRTGHAMRVGAAFNSGAALAKGEFLIFLNSAAVPLPGWHEPLLNDFAAFPNIAATGPLLLYPESEPFGFTVHHLGICITPNLKIEHLYEGIPANAPLARKRRFFQMIAGTCMVIRRELFHATGAFDERFTDGLEAVDLCARLWNAGYTMTVNPEARVVHHTSQTPGRKTYDAENSRLLGQDGLYLLVPDWHIHLKNDGFRPAVNSWLSCSAENPGQLRSRASVAKLHSPEKKGILLDLIQAFPLDAELYQSLAELLESEGDFCQASVALQTGLKMSDTPAMRLDLERAAVKSGNTALAQQATALLEKFSYPFHQYVNMAEQRQEWCTEIGLEELAKVYADWLAKSDERFQQDYRPVMKRLRSRQAEGIPETSPVTPCALGRKKRQPTVSVIVPSYNYAAFLPYTLENVLSETGITLDVIVVDDGSADNTAEVARSFGKEIRYIHQENQGLPAARNTGIQAAKGEYILFLDADDLVCPGTVRSQCEILEHNRDADLAVCLNQLFTSPSPAGPFSPSGGFPLPKGAFTTWFCLRNIAPVHAFMARRSLVENVGAFDVSLRAVEDYDFWLKCLAHGSQIVINDKGLVFYRQHGQSMSNLKHQQQLIHEYLIRERVERLLKENDNFAAGVKTNGWLAHASRCFDLAISLMDIDAEKTASVMNAGIVAIKNVAKAVAFGKADSLYTGEDGEASRHHVLFCMTRLDILCHFNMEHATQARDIVVNLFPEASLAEDLREHLKKELFAKHNCPALSIPDFADWQTRKQA